MSKIEVNQIASQIGGVLTIGASGDTVTLAAGASQSGFGRSGSVNWDTTPKTSSPVTAVSGNGYFINTTSGAITVNLPSTPAAGDIVAIADYANTSATNNITVGRNGSKIDGENTDAVIFVNGQVYTLVYVDATEVWKTVGQTFNQIAVPTYIVATGGTITTCGDYKIHSFTGPGTFTVCSVGNPAGSDSVQTLIVAGGGGGGNDRASGGGAGGLILTPSAGISVSATAYPISIGGGGVGGTPPSLCGAQGTPTTGFSLTAVGGGKGSRGGGGAPISTTTGGPGGSGGGGSVGCGAPSVGPGGPGTQPTQPGNSGAYGFGNNGGSGNPGYPVTSTGGGGGANAVGGSGTPTTSGAGGAGKDVTSIFGASPKAFYGPTNGIYAGGGGGAKSDIIPGNTGGLGGSGGGGPGGKSPANGPGPGVGEAGTTNTGGGGGGGANITPTQCGGAGGSGIVLIRYKYQ